MAGIAAIQLEPAVNLVALEVQSAESSTLAEGMAAIRAVAFLASTDAPAGSRIFTDCRQMVNAVEAPRGRPRKLGELAAELRAMLYMHGFVYDDRGRATITPAHNASRHALKCWLAGRDGVETWRRNFYSRAAREVMAEPRGPFADLGRMIEEAAAAEAADRDAVE